MPKQQPLDELNAAFVAWKMGLSIEGKRTPMSREAWFNVPSYDSRLLHNSLDESIFYKTVQYRNGVGKEVISSSRHYRIKQAEQS